MLHRLYVNIERHKMGGDILAVQICRTLRLIVSVNTFRIQIILYRDGCLFSFAILVFLTQRNSTRLQVVMVQLAGCLGWSVTLSLLTHLHVTTRGRRRSPWREKITARTQRRVGGMGGEPLVPAILVSQEERLMSAIQSSSAYMLES